MAIWNTHVVTCEEGVMDVAGVTSICCAKDVPARSPNNRAEIAPTQPRLEIKYRARTGRILTARFRPLPRPQPCCRPAGVRFDSPKESESKFSKYAFRKLRGADGPEGDAGARPSRPDSHPRLPRGLRAGHRHGVFRGGRGEPLLLQLSPSASRPARLRGRGPRRGWTRASMEDAHLLVRHPEGGAGSPRGARRDATPHPALDRRQPAGDRRLSGQRASLRTGVAQGRDVPTDEPAGDPRRAHAHR